MRRWGLRSRVTVVFGCGALLLSVALALVAYETTRRNLLTARESTSVRAAYFDAAIVRQGLLGEEADVVEVLRSLDTGQQRRPLLLRDGQWFARNADDGLTSSVPPALIALVAEGQPGRQLIEVEGTPAIVTGVPLPRVGADYFEVESLTQLEQTLATLAGTLTVAALFTTAAGSGLGWWAGRRLIRPLGSVAAAARSIAGGDLSARLDDAGDPDLAPLARSFNTMVDEVVQRMQRDRRFAADVSHELRSPLQTLSAASSVLDRRSGDLDPRSQQAARLVSEEVQRFSLLVQDLLELATDDGRPVREPTDVAELLREVCRRTREGLADHLEVHPALPLRDLDRRRVERVVANLVENADRHGGGVVRLAAFLDGGLLVLEVDDEGPGVPLEERGLVFDRFGRGSASSSRGGAEGTGLGLSLVTEHVAAMGGRVLVSDRPGGGARFRVELP